jgi:hypothetical protein
VLNSGKKIAILAGAGALKATDEVIESQGGAAGRSALGDGLDRSPRHQAELRADDRVRRPADDRLRLSLSEFLPKEGQARGVPFDTAASFPASIARPHLLHPWAKHSVLRVGQTPDPSFDSRRVSVQSFPDISCRGAGKQIAKM